MYELLIQWNDFWIHSLYYNFFQLPFHVKSDKTDGGRTVRPINFYNGSITYIYPHPIYS